MSLYTVIMEFEGAFFMGALLFDDRALCRGIERLLRVHCGCSIEAIGALDASYTL